MTVKKLKYELIKSRGSELSAPVNENEIRERISTLMPKQAYIANVMFSGNVPFLQGFPGTAKSAWYQRIADAIGVDLLILWLSRCDETDFSLPMGYDKDGIKVHTMTTPEWALQANKSPTIILAEELNRCSQGIMNAMLGVFQERTLGFGFKFNDNVWFGSCGNFGDADGTVVNDFDTALVTRLVPIKHQLTAQEWLDDFAKAANDKTGLPNIHPIITQYIEAKPGHIYRFNKNTRDKEGLSRPYANPRTYHNLSKYLMTVVGKDAGFDAVANEINEHGIDFIGTDVSDLVRWVEDNASVTINDILNRYDQVKAQIKPPRIPEFFKELKGIEFVDLSEKKVMNLKAFFTDVEALKMNDQLMSYFESNITKFSNERISKLIGVEGPHRDFVKTFKQYVLDAHSKARGVKEIKKK